MTTEDDIKSGAIDRELPRERVPLLERCETPRGVASELVNLHELITDRGYLPQGSDIAIRFSLLTGIAAGTIWRLEGELEAARGGGKP